MVGHIQSKVAARREWLPQSTLLYEDEYICLALVTALDVVLTYVLLQSGGFFYSPMVDAVLTEAGLIGLLSLKLFFVAVVVMGCETLGHRRANLGRKVITLVNLLAVGALAFTSYQLIQVMG